MTMTKTKRVTRSSVFSRPMKGQARPENPDRGAKGIVKDAGQHIANDFQARQRQSERAFLALFDTFDDFDDLVKQCVPMVRQSDLAQCDVVLPSKSPASNPTAATEVPRGRTIAARSAASRTPKTTTSERRRVAPIGILAVRSARR